MDKANKKVLLADESKFDHSTLLTYASLKDINILISDKTFSDSYTGYFTEHNVKIIGIK